MILTNSLSRTFSSDAYTCNSLEPVVNKMLPSICLRASEHSSLVEKNLILSFCEKEPMSLFNLMYLIPVSFAADLMLSLTS